MSIKKKPNKLTVSKSNVNFTAVAKTDNTITFLVQNNNIFSLAEGSFINYRCYEEDGSVSKEGKINLAGIGFGGRKEIKVYVYSGTAKIGLGDITLKRSSFWDSKPVKSTGRVKVNSLPYTSNGVTVESFVFEGCISKVIVRNNSGKDIKHCRLQYRCYDNDNVIIGTAESSISYFPNGERARLELYMTDGTERVLLDNIVY